MCSITAMWYSDLKALRHDVMQSCGELIILQCSRSMITPQCLAPVLCLSGYRRFPLWSLINGKTWRRHTSKRRSVWRNCINTLCSKKHSLTLSSISSRIMHGLNRKCCCNFRLIFAYVGLSFLVTLSDLWRLSIIRFINLNNFQNFCNGWNQPFQIQQADRSRQVLIYLLPRKPRCGKETARCRMLSIHT